MDLDRAKFGSASAQRSAVANKSNADAWALRVWAEVEKVRKAGVLTLAAQARALNSRGFKTRYGHRKWSAQSLYVTLRRARELRGDAARNHNKVLRAVREQWLRHVSAGVRKARGDGAVSNAEVARALNVRGSRTFLGRRWTAVSVCRVLRQLRDLSA